MSRGHLQNLIRPHIVRQTNQLEHTLVVCWDDALPTIHLVGDPQKVHQQT